MAYNHYSPFTYETDSPFYIPAFNHNHHQPSEYSQQTPDPTQYDKYQYSPAENTQPHPDLDLTIHPNSAAAQLGLTPEELAPILKEQQEFLDTASYEPKRYEHPLAECAQP